MKPFCLLILPRQITTLFLVLCSCHMLLLLNWIQGPIADSPSTEQSSGTAYRSVAKASITKATPLLSTSGNHSQTYDGELVSRAESLPRRDDLLMDSIWSHDVPRAPGEGNGADNARFNEMGKVPSRTGSRNSPVDKPVENQMRHRENKRNSTVSGTSLGIKKREGLGERMSKHFALSKPPIIGNMRNSLQNTPDTAAFNFTFLINQPHVCTQNDENNRTVHSIILVHSHPFNKAQREAIRSSWGKRVKDVDSRVQLRLVFILGFPYNLPSHQEQMRRVLRESLLYKDIVMGNFNDTYSNLTLKSLYALHWVTQFCNNTHFTVKADDDTFIHIDALRSVLEQSQSEHLRLFGALNTDAKVQRTGIWSVSRDIFPHETYPPYCTGCIYAIATDIIPQLLHSARTASVLPVEDVFITGVLAQLNGLTCSAHRAFPQWVTFSSFQNRCRLKCDELVALHRVQDEAMFDIQNLLDGKSENYCDNYRCNSIT